jgi:hypothetical protein
MNHGCTVSRPSPGNPSYATLLQPHSTVGNDLLMGLRIEISPQLARQYRVNVAAGR